MTQRHLSINLDSRIDHTLLLDWETHKQGIKNIRIQINQDILTSFPDEEQFGDQQEFVLPNLGRLIIRRKGKRFLVILAGENMIQRCWKNLLMRAVAEMAILSGVLFFVLMMMDGISWLVGGQGLLYIWPKGRLSVFPIWVSTLVFAGIRFGVGAFVLKKPNWITTLLVMLSLILELRFIQSVYELWFYFGMTFILVPLLWVGVRFSKSWRKFGLG